MAASRQLRNPPVTEALVDLRAIPSRPISPEVLPQLRDAVRDRYPVQREKRIFSSTWMVKDEMALQQAGKDEGLHGYQFQSADGCDIAQFRVDGFTYNRLKPYTDGEAVLSEALRLWAIYVAIAAPPAVSRAALRYINHLPLPGSVLEMDRYLTAAPKCPEGLPGDVLRFLSRHLVQSREFDFRAMMTVSSEPMVGGNGLTILVDIDVFREAEMGTESPEIRPALETLREAKNRAFFGALTEDAVRLFE